MAESGVRGFDLSKYAGYDAIQILRLGCGALKLMACLCPPRFGVPDFETDDEFLAAVKRANSEYDQILHEGPGGLPLRGRGKRYMEARSTRRRI